MTSCVLLKSSLHSFLSAHYSWGSPLRGSYNATRDASVTTYGEFNAGLFAGRDIGFDSFSGSSLAGVTGSGDIRGLISADRNIQNEIISHGTINATFYAHNTAQTSDGGKIGNIIAWGSIAGLVVAESSIGNLRSGDAITATLDAPQIGTITEFDADVVTDFPMPTVPRTLIVTILLAFVGSGCVETRKSIGDYSKQTRKIISKWANKKRTQSRTQNVGQYG